MLIFVVIKKTNNLSYNNRKMKILVLNWQDWLNPLSGGAGKG